VKSDLRELSAELKVLETRQQEAQQAVEQRAWAAQALEDHQKLAGLQQAASETSLKAAGLWACLEELGAAESELGALRAVEQEGGRLLQRIRDLEEMENQLRGLENAVLQTQDVEQQAQIQIPDLGDLEGLSTKLIRQERKLKRLEELVEEVSEGLEEIAELDVQIAKWEAKLGEVKVCPTCGKAI